MKGFNLLLVTLICSLNCACSRAQPESHEVIVASNPAQTAVATACSNPRPELCTQEYAPVCATKDNGIRCIKAPCPSTDKATYSNGCAACADKDVYSYQLGACQ